MKKIQMESDLREKIRLLEESNKQLIVDLDESQTQFDNLQHLFDKKCQQVKDQKDELKKNAQLLEANRDKQAELKSEIEALDAANYKLKIEQTQWNCRIK